MPLLTLIRHGQSTYNLENRFTGNLDVELTAFGEDEARVAAGKLNGIHYAFAYTSMLRRAQDTLRIILKEMRNDYLPIRSAISSIDSSSCLTLHNFSGYLHQLHIF